MERKVQVQESSVCKVCFHEILQKNESNEDDGTKKEIGHGILS